MQKYTDASWSNGYTTSHQCVPDSEIRIDNIIPGSPEYILYKQIKSGKKGSKNLVTVSVDMAKSKQTLTKGQVAKAKAKKELKLAKDATETEWQTKGGRKVPQKQLATIPSCKSGKGAEVKKPRHNWALLALHEIHHYQKSVDLLIPLFPFQRLIWEIVQDFRMDLWFQSGAILAIQEAMETFLVQLFKAVNLCAIHRNHQTIAPKDFSLVKRIWHIAGINMWWQ